MSFVKHFKHHRTKIVLGTLIILILALTLQLTFSIIMSENHANFRVLLFSKKNYGLITKFDVIFSAVVRFVVRFLLFFTVQNNFLIVIILFAYLKEKWQKNEIFKRLKFNTLIWNLTTMIIYFVFLFPLWSIVFFSESEDESVFFSVLKTWEKIISLVCSFALHLFSPMLYTFIYYLYDEHEFMLNKRIVEFRWNVYNNFKFWVYPLLYFLLCIFISNINFYYLNNNGGYLISFLSTRLNDYYLSLD